MVKCAMFNSCLGYAPLKPKDCFTGTYRKAWI